MFLLLIFFTQTSLGRAELVPSVDPNELLRQLSPEQREACGPQIRKEFASWDLCAGTVESVCGPGETEPLLNTQEIRKAIFRAAEISELEKLSVTIRKAEKSPGEQKALRAYAGLMEKAYLETKRIGKEKGAQFTKLRPLLEEIKDELLQYLSTSAQFRNNKSTLRGLKNVELFDPSFFAKADEQDLLGFYRSCGSDGLDSHAYYDAKLNKVVLCPGYLLNNAKPEGLNAMVLLLAHELGHAADPLQTDANDALYLLDGYGGYLECLEKNYAKEFRSIANANELLKNERQPMLAECVRKLRAAKALDKDIAEIESAFDSATTRITEQNEMKAYFEEMFDSPTPVITHSAELAADMLGTEVSGRLLMKVAPELRPSLVRAQLNFFCRLGEKARRSAKLCGTPENKETETGDNGTHPGFAYRVETYLRNPAVRAALGCPSLPQSQQKPWCGL